MARIVFNITLLTVFGIVALYGAGALVRRECETELCRQDCDAISVDRIIDGDTFESAGHRIRLHGVDMPERGEPCFAQATERLRRLAGRTVRVESGPRARDQFGRLLYYVYTKNGESVDERLIAKGLGRAWTGAGQYCDVLVSLENAARLDGAGCLW